MAEATSPPIKYAHKEDWEGPPLQQLDGATVYNAPRPLLGDKTWTGAFRHGIFYAAVFPGEYAEAWARSNVADDAYVVVFVDNADVERILADELAANGYELAAYHELGMTTAEAAASHGLPWREPTPTEAEHGAG